MYCAAVNPVTVSQRGRPPKGSLGFPVESRLSGMQHVSVNSSPAAAKRFRG